MSFKKPKEIVTIILLALASLAIAQSPSTEIILTWESNSYAPSTYQGKILAGPNSTISVALQTLYSGRPMSVNSKKISWYINNRFMKADTGLTNFVFSTKDIRANSYTVKAIIRDYEKKRDVSTSIVIPGVSPLTVINAPYPNKLVATSLFLEAIPYFFNIANPSQLSFTWDIAGTLVHSQNVSAELDGEEKGVSIPITLQVDSRTSFLEKTNNLIILKSR